jgi:hypothetical protein
MARRDAGIREVGGEDESAAATRAVYRVKLRHAESKAAR